MGFCLFNNVAVGALHAFAEHGCKRVAVLDFDVHHGNGTQDIFARDGAFFFASVHQSPLYPGTGAQSERGVGNILNVPLPPMADGEMFRHAWGEVVMPRVIEFAPEFVFISAGFDAHEADPLASLRYREDDFQWATAEAARIARDCCGGRLVSTLEGGYDLDALGASAAAHVRALMAA
jgi:acetoin utilization deacetylase AcuC-like enzyme